MIGQTSFLIETIGVLFPSIFVAAGLDAAISRRKRVGFAIAAFAGVVFVLVGVRYVQQVRNHVFLKSLTADSVLQIRVGSRTLSERHEVSPIVDALRDRQWFSSTHGGWADEVPLVVILNTGQGRRFRVAYYLRQEGAIIAFSRGGNGSYWSDGYAFSRSLPRALKEVGVSLPSQP